VRARNWKRSRGGWPEAIGWEYRCRTRWRAAPRQQEAGPLIESFCVSFMPTPGEFNGRLRATPLNRNVISRACIPRESNDRQPTLVLVARVVNASLCFVTSKKRQGHTLANLIGGLPDIYGVLCAGKFFNYSSRRRCAARLCLLLPRKLIYSAE